MNTFAIVGLSALGLIVLVFALIGVLYLTRGTPIERVVAWGDPDGPPAVSEAQFCPMMALHAKAPLLPGHSITIAINGDQTYDRLWADLRSARVSITLQMYYFLPGRMANELKAILLERARAGVRVLLLHDAFGSQELPEEYVDEMVAGGVAVAAFRPVRWYQLHKTQHRSHIRVVVVDGRLAWTGGFGIDDKWYGDGRHENQWRDTNVRFEGPCVVQHQATFAAGWAEATGELLTGELFFPGEATEPKGTVVAGCMHAAPTIGSTAAERYLALSIAAAERTLYITNSYFVPDDSFCDLLGQAAERGVDVRILTAGRETDVKTTWRAGRARYEALLARGVKIYEYRPTMVHAKTLVADGTWVAIGTLNFDNRSLAFNDESVLLAYDDAIGGDMEQIFREDLPFSDEILLEEFRRRGTRERVLEQMATSISRIL